MSKHKTIFVFYMEHVKAIVVHSKKFVAMSYLVYRARAKVCTGPKPDRLDQNLYFFIKKKSFFLKFKHTNKFDKFKTNNTKYNSLKVNKDDVLIF